MRNNDIPSELWKLKNDLEERLIIGATVTIGAKCAAVTGMKAGSNITLIEGHFEHDNGLYTEDQTAPSVWSEEDKDFNSIYHMFGNDLEYFLDCEIESLANDFKQEEE
jgi:hypothetical protein